MGVLQHVVYTQYAKGYPLFSARPIHSNPERDSLVSRIALATAAKARVDRGEAVPATNEIDKYQVARNPVPGPWTRVSVKSSNLGRVVVHTYTTCPLKRQEKESHKKPRLRFLENKKFRSGSTKFNAGYTPSQTTNMRTHVAWASIGVS